MIDIEESTHPHGNSIYLRPDQILRQEHYSPQRKALRCSSSSTYASQVLKVTAGQHFTYNNYLGDNHCTYWKQACSLRNLDAPPFLSSESVSSDSQYGSNPGMELPGFFLLTGISGSRSRNSELNLKRSMKYYTTALQLMREEMDASLSAQCKATSAVSQTNAFHRLEWRQNTSRYDETSRQ